MSTAHPTEEYEYVDEHWVMRHPSAVLSILFGAFMVAQWAGARWLRDQEQPRWDKLNGSITALGRHDQDLANFNLEQSRYIISTLEAIASAGGVSLPERDEELTRSIARVRLIKDGKN